MDPIQPIAPLTPGIAPVTGPRPAQPVTPRRRRARPPGEEEQGAKRDPRNHEDPGRQPPHPAADDDGHAHVDVTA